MTPDPVDVFDRWNEDDLRRAPSPRAEAQDALVAAIRIAGRGRRRAPAWAYAAAAVVLLGLGIWIGARIRPSDEPSEPPVPAAWADHERRVLAEVREGLGEEVAWIASAGGEMLLGFDPDDGTRERRVVFLELRDASGRVVHAPRMVVPDGRRVAVALPDLPHLEVRATASDADRVDIQCAAVFDDGATLAATLPTVANGERVLVGQVVTGGRSLALYAAAR